MAVTFVAASAVVTGDNPTVAVPAGYAEKDLLIIVTTGTATPATPSGWTASKVQGSNGFLTILTRFATSSESSVTLSLLGTTTSAVMLAYRGASAIDTISGITNTTSGTSLAPGQTGNTSTNDCEISVWVADNIAGTWGAAPSPTTSRVTSNPTTAVNGIFVVDETQAASGASTARTATITNLHNISALAIAVIPSGRYWVGGTGTWDTTTTTNWSQTSGGVGGAKVPTANDSVFFDQSATYTVTMTGALTCYNITTSAGTVTFATGTTPTLAVSGSMSLIAGTVWNSTGATTFNSTRTAGETITTNGTTLNGSVTFNGVGGTWALGSALTTSLTATTTLTNGAINLNGYDLTTGIFSSSNTNTRSITFGANYIILAHTTAAQTVLSMATATGFTYTSSGTFGSGTGCFQSTMSTTRTFVFGTTGGSVTNAPRLYLVSGASIATLTTGSWFNEINFGTTAFTIAATNQNLSSLVSNNSTSVLTGLTATMVGTGTIAVNTSIGPLVINNGAASGTTTLYAGTTTCTTCTLTSGTFDNNSQTLTCSSTFTWTSGSLLNIGAINCTTFTLNGPTFNFTSGTITPSTSFVLTSGSFTYNGGTLSAVPTFTHTAGTVQFNNNYALTATGTYTFTAGTLTLADNVTLATGIFSSTNTNTRSIAFGNTSAGNINLTHTTAATVVLSMGILTGFTYTGIGGFTVADMANTRTFTCGTTGGTSLIAPNLTFTTGASVATITTAGWFNKLDYGTTTFTQAASTLNVNSITLSATGTYTALILNLRGSGTLTYNGKTTAAVTLLEGSPTLADTIACTTFTVNGPTWNFTSGTLNPTTSFVVTSGGFTYNGGTLGAVPTFTHTNGTVTFNYNYSLAVTGTYTLTAGTLSINDGLSLSTGIFSSTGAGTRAIVFGTTSAGNINLTHTTAATVVLNMAALGGFSYTGTGGFTVADMANTRTFSVGNTSGGSTTTAPRLSFTTGASIATLTTGGWFNNLDFGTTSFAIPATSLSAAGSLILSSSGTYTGLTVTMLSSGTTTLTTNGKTIAALTINGGQLSPTSALTITGALSLLSGSINTAYPISSGSFNGSGPSDRSIIGTNTTYTVTGAGATAWNLAPIGSVLLNGTSQYLPVAANPALNFGTSNFTFECWVYITGYGTTTGFFTLGSELAGRYYFGLQSSGQPWSNVFGGANYNWGVSGSVPLNAWTHVAWVNVGGTVSCYVNGISLGTQNFSGNVGNAGGATIAANPAGGYLWPGYITNVRFCSIAVYTGNFTVPTKPLTPIQSASTNISAITGSQTAFLLAAPNDSSFLKDFSVNNIAVTNTGTATSNASTPFSAQSVQTFSGFTINMTNAAAKTFAGGGGTYPVLNNGGAGALTISGSNTFDNITNSVQPTTFTFTSLTTQTVNNFDVRGIAGSLVTINASTAASAATLTKASGIVYGSYLSIQDSTATGGATWYAGPTSTSVSNNTGWIFTQLPIITMGNLTVAGGGFTVSNLPV